MPTLTSLGKAVARLDAHELGLIVAERIVRLQIDSTCMTDLLSFQLLLDTRKDAVISAVQIAHRFRGLLDDGAIGIAELVGQRYDCILRNFH